MSEHPPPATSTPGRRWTWRGLDTILLIGLIILAVQARVAWEDVALSADWPWFIHSANAIALGSPPPYVQLLYSSVPCVVFAGLIRLFQDPDTLLWAWAALGAMSAPLVYLAVRRVGGPAAAACAGTILALSTGETEVVAGIKSPYTIAACSSLAALGLVAAQQRRPWGAPLLVLGAALAVGFHVGLYLIVPAVCLLALVHLLRLPRRRALGAGLACLVLGGLVLGWVLAVDLDRLLEDLDFYRQAFPSKAPARQPARTLWALGLLLDQQRALAGSSGLAAGLHDMFLQGLASTTASLRWTSAVGALGLAVGTGRALLRRRREGRGPDPRNDALLIGLQAWLLVLCGSLIYLKNGWQQDYLQFHHFVSLPPLMLVALAGLGAACSPTRHRGVIALASALALGGWLTLSWGGGLHPPLREASPLPAHTPVIRSARTANQLSRLVRADAEARGAAPAVVLWGPWGDRDEPWLFAALVNTQARLAWRPEGLPAACYLIAPTRRAERIAPGRRLSERAEGLTLIAFDGCEELAELAPELRRHSGTRAWRDDDVGEPMEETAFLDELLGRSLVRR
jgi:hypothetical protein